MIAIPLRHMSLLPLQLFGSLTSAAFLASSERRLVRESIVTSPGSLLLGIWVLKASISFAWESASWLRSKRFVFIGCFMVLNEGLRKLCCAAKYIDFLVVSISRYFIQIQVKFERAKRKHNDIL